MTFDEEDSEALAQSEVVSIAWEFLHAFYKGELVKAWDVVHPQLRLCWLQWWATANKDALLQSGYELVGTAEELARGVPKEHPLWADFERVLLRDFRNAYPLSLATSGIGAASRVIALDTELLYIYPEIPPGGIGEENAASFMYPMVMQLGGSGWTVLNWASDVIPTPGYPPTLSAGSSG
jgi:hypothetical protein